MIEEGSFSAGERLPSIRELSRQLDAGINTISQAYLVLENARVIQARPQSGYYVRSRLGNAAVSAGSAHDASKRPSPSPVNIGEDKLRIMRSIADETLVPLGRGAPAVDLLPTAKLNQMLAAKTRSAPKDCVSYAAGAGSRVLRAQIAKRSLDCGCAWSPDEITVTSGCIEAVTLALQATCQKGDTIAVESPVYYTFLSTIEWMGLNALEIPASAEGGMNLDILSYALRRSSVKACLAIPNFNNPLGGVMPDEKKRELVRILGRFDIPLIEDDVYGDLSYTDTRPMVCKAFDEKGLVLLCSSFSKTLAPGYRVGWIVAGRFQAKVEGLKSLFNLATASPTQLAVAQFLATGGHERHLRVTRRVLRERMEWMLSAIARGFPAGTRVTRPLGGFSVWIELPDNLDSFKLYELALREGISVAPGMLFGTGNQFENRLRLNCSLPPQVVKRPLEIIGRLAQSDRIRKVAPPPSPDAASGLKSQGTVRRWKIGNSSSLGIPVRQTTSVTASIRKSGCA